MPVEREFKYVLSDPHEELYRRLYRCCIDHNWSCQSIEQGYLNNSSRIRHTKTLVIGNKTNYYNPDPDSFKDEGYHYTFKKKIADELIEIETIISSEDYNKLKSVIWPQDMLTKTRFNFKPCPEITWSIDYFYGPELYFVMAEFETTFDIRTPPAAYHMIKDRVVHIDDGTFELTSRVLCNKEEAQHIYKSLIY